MFKARSALLAAVITAALAVPLTATTAQAHCPPNAKAKPHKVVKKVTVKKAAVKKVAVKKVLACNCTVVPARVKHHPAHPSAPRPAPLPPVAHAPYADTGAGYADYGPSRVVDLNAEGWEHATYTSSRIVSRRIVTYYSSGAQSPRPAPHPADCRDRRHHHRY